MNVSQDDLTESPAPATGTRISEAELSETPGSGSGGGISEKDLSTQAPNFFENIRDFAIKAKDQIQQAMDQKQKAAAQAAQNQAAHEADPKNWTADQYKDRMPEPQGPLQQAEYDTTLKSKQDQEDNFRTQYFQKKYGFDPVAQQKEFESLMAPDVKIEAMKPQSFFDKIKSAVANLYTPDTAKSANITNLSNYTKLPPAIVQKHYDDITQELGLRDYPNASELINAGMALSLPVTVDALGPLAVARGIAGFTAAKEGTERVVLPAGKAVWEKMNSEPVKYEVTKLQDLFPENSKDLGTISEFLLYGMGAKGIDDVLSTPEAIKAGNRVMGELNGIRGRILKAMGVQMETGLVPITYEAAQQAFPDHWKDIISQKEWTRYKSDLTEKVNEQNRAAEETRRNVENPASVNESDLHTSPIEPYLSKNLSAPQQKEADFISKNYSAFSDAYDEEVKKEYHTETPNIVSADVAKTVPVPGRPPFQSEMSVDRHEGSSAFAKARYDELLADPKTQNKPVMVMGGVSGAGKTSSLRSAGVDTGSAAAVYDTNMRSISSASRIIDLALDSGRKAEVHYVDRDPLEAFKNGVFPRFLNHDEHRVVPIETHIANYDSRDVIPKLVEKYKNNPDVSFWIYDNSRGKGQASLVDIDKLPNKVYTPNEIRNNLHDYIQNQYQRIQQTPQREIFNEQALKTFTGREGSAAGSSRGQNGSSDVSGPSGSPNSKTPAREKSVTEFHAAEKNAIGGLIDDIQDMEAKRRLPVENVHGETKTLVTGYVPDYLSNIGVTKAKDIPLLKKALNGDPLTVLQNGRVQQLVERWAEEMSQRYQIPVEEIMNPEPFKTPDNEDFINQKLEEANAESEREARDVEGLYDQLSESEKRIIDAGEVESRQSVFEEAKRQVLADALGGSAPVSNSGPKSALNFQRKLTPDEVIDPEDFKVEILSPRTAGNPSSKWSMEVRYKGWAQDQKYFDTKAAAESAKESFKPSGRIEDSVIPDYDRALNASSKKGFEQPARAGATLESAVIPGARQFYEQDVEPFIKGVSSGLQETAKLLTNILVPPSGVSTNALDEIMKMKGTRDELYYKLDAKTKDIENFFNKMPIKEKVAFIDRVKRGEEQPTKTLRDIANMIETIDANQWQYAKRWAPSLGWLENHYRVLWKVIPGTVEDEQNFLGVFKRPLQGSKGFLKHSTLDDMSTGLAAGGVPYTYNPMTMFKKAYADMNKFITAQKMWAKMKEMGLVKFVKNSQSAPVGMVALDDAIARAYFMQNDDTFIPPQELNPEASYRAEEGPAAVQPPGLKEAGRYYMDEGPGRILNNFLSKDHIRATALGRGLLWLKNNSTAIELSLSPFHAVFESLESMGSAVGLGLSKIYNVGLLKQDPRAALEGLKDVLTAPLSPVTTAALGGKAIKYMTKDDFLKSEAGQHFMKEYPEVKDLLSDLFMGGGKLAIAEDYALNSVQSFEESLSSGNYIGASLRALPALNQVAFKPLFEVYIPRLKVGHFLREYSNNLQVYEKDLASGKMTRLQVARMTWRSVENRFGEMNFDNLFWNNNFKTAMQIMARSVTWKIGSLSEYGTAGAGQAKEFYDAAREKRAPRLHPSMAWLFGVTAMTVALAEILQKTLSGKDVANQKDALFPQVDKIGSRVSMPTYWRDIFHLMHDPLAYVRSGLSGEIGRLTDVWNNKDYYGQEIYNFNDPLHTKMWKSAVHVVPLPFSVSSYQSFKKAGVGSPVKELGFAGFTRAPGYINQTPLQQEIFSLYQKRFGSSGAIPKQEFEKQQVRSQIKSVIQQAQKAREAGENEIATQKYQQAQGLIRDAIKNGQLTQKGLGAFQANAKLPPDIRAFKRLPQSDQVSLMEKMKPDELASYKKYASKNSIREFNQNGRQKQEATA